MEEQHIASAFDRDLQKVQDQVLKMGGMVEAAIRDSSNALKRRDSALAEEVRQRDAEIDRLDDEINAACAQIIALRQPIASDLRLVLSVMKIAGNLERIGDYAKNLAKRTPLLIEMATIEGTGVLIERMLAEVGSMLSDALDSYIRHDKDLANQVYHRDFEVDQMYNALFRELLTFMMEDPRSITASMHLHFIAKNTERMGDHVTSIANQVVYFVTGEYIEEERPKSTDLKGLM